MNKEAILKNTTSFRDDLLEDLKDPEFAQYYLEAAIRDYEEDGDNESLIIAIRDVTQVQGSIGKVMKESDVKPQHLYDVVDSLISSGQFTTSLNS